MANLDQDEIQRRIFIFHRHQSRNDPPRIGNLPLVDGQGQAVLLHSIIIESTYFSVTGPLNERYYSGKLIIAIPVVYLDGASPQWNVSDTINSLSREDWRFHGEKFLGRWA